MQQDQLINFHIIVSALFDWELQNHNQGHCNGFSEEREIPLRPNEFLM